MTLNALLLVHTNRYWNVKEENNPTLILDLSKLKAFADDKENDSKVEICFVKCRIHSEKRRKCWLPAFSSFPTTF